MGYEIKLIAGEITSDKSFIEIASVDLSKIGNGPLSKIIAYAKGKETPDFNDWKFLKDVKGAHLGLDALTSEIFDVGMNYNNVSIWEGVDKISEDPYGDPLPAVPVQQILVAIDAELKVEKYRRFELAKQMLEELASSKWDSIFVVPYGH
jgi:hypothetical protein